MNSDEVVLERISKFVHWLAKRCADDATPLMDVEEVVGELFYEVSKGMRYYEDRPLNELLALLRKMCDNRVAELKYRYYKTHRVAARFSVSLDVLDDSERGDNTVYKHPGYRTHVQVEDDTANTVALVGSALRVQETRRRLSPIGQQVFDVVIMGTDGRVAAQILLAGMRASSVFQRGSVRIKPRHVSEAIPELSEKDVKIAFAEIRAAYREVRMHG